jgi:hypothetical protein
MWTVKIIIKKKKRRGGGIIGFSSRRGKECPNRIIHIYLHKTCIL